MQTPEVSNGLTGLEIAIIGMAGRFPGASTIEVLWQKLRDGVESVSVFSDDELKAAGIDPALLSNPDYVKASAVLDDIELFDTAFFGLSPREADITDPQHRLFLECAWEALENAGYDPQRYPGAIGVFAGVGMSSYATNNVQLDRDFIGTAEDYQAQIGNQKDFLSTRVAYKFNLKGPSITVQSACSTSLVAVHLACQSLISGDSDIALAGGVSIRVPQRVGYLYQPGGVISPDGHCRAFDVRAQGTVVGNGVGIVVLKRLEDALADGDCIQAIIKGSAVNNDGSLKVGYMAPSVDGQAKVIRAAQQIAEVEPETIGYIETHGTGTALGDPIEIAALTQAFQARTQQKGFCAIGSLKTNIGHLDVAAGVAGLIKATLALRHRQIPPSLHFERPNPSIDIASSPFYVNTTLTDWQTKGTPRRAGVSAFGIGGTNAHVILQESPPIEEVSESRPWQLIVLSARTDTALERATANLANYLRRNPASSLADTAYTLQLGRRAFNHRRVVVCRDLADAVATLEQRTPQLTATIDTHDCPIVFMFPGGSAQYVNMGRELYQSEAVFREQIDCCVELLRPHLQLDLRRVLYPSEERVEDATAQLRSTAVGLPALFATEYALAKLWMSWGIRPQAMIGHSLGEYVAACLSGVISLGDALAMVAVRATPPGRHA
jgi:acyl transferase domain-containing protein